MPAHKGCPVQNMGKQPPPPPPVVKSTHEERVIHPPYNNRLPLMPVILLYIVEAILYYTVGQR